MQILTSIQDAGQLCPWTFDPGRLSLLELSDSALRRSTEPPSPLSLPAQLPSTTSLEDDTTFTSQGERPPAVAASAAPAPRALRTGFTLSPDQASANERVLKWLLSTNPTRARDVILSGPAGTGKTTVLKMILAEYRELCRQQKRPCRITFTATTNKAAAVLRSIIGEEARTIHSLLDIRPKKDTSTGEEVFEQLGEPDLIPGTAIVVDEASMIDKALLSLIRKIAKTKGCYILFVGDPYQLPPVKEMSSPVFTKIDRQALLTQVHRQADGNPLISIATAFREVLDGKAWPEGISDCLTPHGGTRVLPKAAWQAEMLSAFTEKDFSADPDRIRAVAWTNKRVTQLNHMIRPVVLGEEKAAHKFVVGEIVTSGSPVLEEGAVALQTDENAMVVSAEPHHDQRYDVQGHLLGLKNLSTGLVSEGIFVADDRDDVKNVLSGLAKAAQIKTKACRANPGDKSLDRERRAAWVVYFRAKEYFADVRYPYASTVHKSQGSTFEDVFIDVGNIGRCTHNTVIARLLYVALTRPRRWAVTTGSLPKRLFS